MSEQNNKPFPTFAEFEEWNKKIEYRGHRGALYNIHNYFSQFRYETEVMPEVGKEYKVSFDGNVWFKDTLIGYETEKCTNVSHIRPIQTLTRESIIEKARQVLSEEEIAILTGTTRI